MLIRAKNCTHTQKSFVRFSVIHVRAANNHVRHPTSLQQLATPLRLPRILCLAFCEVRDSFFFSWFSFLTHTHRSLDIHSRVLNEAPTEHVTTPTHNCTFPALLCKIPSTCDLVMIESTCRRIYSFVSQNYCHLLQMRNARLLFMINT